MNKNSLLITVLGLVAGFIIGFMICNNFFYVRNAGAAAPTTAGPNQGDQAPADADPNEPRPLSPEEIRNLIARADANPNDRELQKNLSLSLFQYAVAMKDGDTLLEVRRLLERANQGNKTDVQLLTAAGDVNFFIAHNTDSPDFKKAREYYNQVLALQPNDANVRTTLGLTYFFDRPSDPARAIAEYRKSLQVDARNESTLRYLSSALIATGSLDEATKLIAKLEAVNPSNPALSDLRAQLAQKRNAANP